MIGQHLTTTELAELRERAIVHAHETEARRAGTTIVYVLDADHGTKVGITVQTIDERIADLERAGGFRPLLVAAWVFERNRDARDVERIADWLLEETRTVGEWFHCHPLEAVSAVQRAMREPGILVRYLQARDSKAAAA